MKLTSRLLAISPTVIQQKIAAFIKAYVKKAGTKGIVLGISGGVDSATTAALSTIAVGGDRVLGIHMPEKETYNIEDYEHVQHLAKEFQFQLKTIDLTETLNSFYNAIPDYDRRDKLSRGNLKARARMLVLYYYANSMNLIVVGSSDKSETMIGYYTKWGDAAVDLAPIMDLYKTQVRQLALNLGVPETVVQKPSSPTLWPNQIAEEEIGLKYEVLDLVLYGLEHFMDIQTISKQLNLPYRTVASVKRRWIQTEHKRHMPLTAKLEYRTVDADFRLSRTIEFK